MQIYLCSIAKQNILMLSMMSLLLEFWRLQAFSFLCSLLSSVKKAYLYFSLYLLALSIGKIQNTYYEMYDVFFRQFPIVYLYVFDALWFFPTFFLIHFIRHLLNTKNYLPKWNKFCLFWSCYML